LAEGLPDITGHVHCVHYSCHVTAGGGKNAWWISRSRKLLDDLVEKSVGAPNGAIIFYAMGKAYLFRPPFPVKTGGAVQGYEPTQLQEMLKRDWNLALVLVRLGYYAVGVFRGEQLIDGKAGTGLVHARHHKGGSSSGRFARHREKQMETFSPGLRYMQGRLFSRT